VLGSLAEKISAIKRRGLTYLNSLTGKVGNEISFVR